MSHQILGSDAAIDIWRQFISGDFAPHGYCLLWSPLLIWTHVASDALIAAAYFSIPVALIWFVRRRNDVAFGWMIWLFAVFILACGTTHVMGIWNLWHGDYAAEGLVKAITAMASVPTAILLWRLIPQALLIPSPMQLQLVNEQLRASIAERDEAVRQLKAEIAQRERAEAALLQAQKMDAIGQLTGGIAHDFNNLLQAIGGNLGMVRAQPGNVEKVKRWVDNASHAVARGVNLTGQLLAFSRTQRLEMRSLELNTLVDGMRELVQSSVGTLVRCDFVLSPQACPINGDPTQLELAILNLAINARDAMPNGGVLTISTSVITLGTDEVELSQGQYVQLCIADTGVGMPQEVLERALEPFFTTKGLGAGTGLGLSMAFAVARQSSGTLRLRSSVGVGTTATLLLPLAQTDATQASVNEASPDELTGDALAGLRIAVIDDDADVRQFVVDCLETHGATCAAFGGGEEFLAWFPDASVDVVFSDFAMPTFSGAEVAKHARRINPRVPVVIMTGYAESDALDEILGDVAIMRKPFTAASLLAIAQQFLRKKVA